ncbi:hypothetical protein [Bacillus sp. EB600]|uniref:hypothetical protein n=1 Tax=Bacillus sp. EB600 TaxID=2806345 RepID=UPI00210D0DF2|nr:hypothetical protein [Bacillus sp. EB600]MCQ6282800.1 hypothetical protein [Bacillus sp. EB600]
MTKDEFEEFQERIAWGEEFNFYYQNEEYWVSQNQDGYYLTRVKGSFTQEFKTPELLFKNGTIQGKLLSEIFMDIEW